MVEEAAVAGVRCLFVKCQLIAKRPKNPAYPAELKTLGDHLRKVRLNRGLFQSDVAKILNVTTDAVTNWELNRNEPTTRLAKLIIDFLGYFPFPTKDISFGKQLYHARMITGKTQKQVAALIGCDTSNLRLIELDKRKPNTRVCGQIQGFIDSVADSREGEKAPL